MQIQKKLMMTGLALSSLFVGVVLPSTVIAQGADRNAQAQERRAEAEAKTQEVQTQVEERKAEILERVEAKRAEVREKLDEKRKEICEKRAGKINAIVDRSVVQSEKHLAVFQTIEERVVAFYQEKGLTSSDFDAALANADEKEAAAIAAVEATESIDFDCEQTDAKNVGGDIRGLMQSHHAALKEYRTAVKDLIVTVKQATKTAEEASEETTEQNATDQTEATEPEANQESQE